MTPAKPAWHAVLSIAVGVAALIVAELLPISLLTPLATDLGLSRGLTGQAVTATAFAALIAGLTVAVLSGRLDRRTLLLGLSATLIVSNLLVAAAPNFVVLLTGRLLLGIALGGIWSMAASLSIRLVPKALVPRALSIIFGGSAIAMVVATPLGSLLGGLLGWRNVFVAAAGLGFIALALQWMTLPSLPPIDRPRFSTLWKVAKRSGVTIGLVALILGIAGSFTIVTYLRPILEQIAGVEAASLPLFLLIYGVGGLVGTAFAGQVAERNPFIGLLLPPAAMAIDAMLLLNAGQDARAVMPLVGLWGAASGSLPVAWSSWFVRLAPDQAETIGGLVVAAIQFAITVGAFVGGIALDRLGSSGALMASTTLLICAVIATAWTTRSRYSGLGSDVPA